MKKTLYILSALLLGLVSCNKAELEAPQGKKAEETGLVAITMKVQIPEVQLNAMTKADGKFSHTPDITDMRVAVFGTSGYPQAYARAEPIVSATDETAGSYATTNHKDGTTTDIYYFKVLLPVYEGEAHVHIIANGPKTIKFVDEDEDSIMKQMHSEDGIGAFWARIVMPDGILTQLDQNGIMQTDKDGNFIPSDGTAHLFEDLVLVRNFAEVQLSVEDGVDNITDISWTLVNVPKYGSVAPMANGTFVDDYKTFAFNTDTWRMEHGTKTYEGYLFPGEPIENPDSDGPKDNTIDYTRPTVGVDDPLEYVIDPTKPVPSAFMYERTHPGSDKATCILMKARFNNGTGFDSFYTYYRLDLTEESVGGYFPIYRNYLYQMKIHKVGNRGARTIDEAMNRDSGGNVSQSTEAKKLTDISDGESRLFVEYVEKNFTSGGTKGLWVQYVPDVTSTYTDSDGNLRYNVDNTNVTVTVKTRGDALLDGTPATLTPVSGSTKTGYNFYEFDLNKQTDKDLVSVLEVKATNYTGTVPAGKEKSTLYRDITLRVLKTMEMHLKLVPQKVDAVQGEVSALQIILPENLPSSMFPLEFKIEDTNHTLYSTGYDGTGTTPDNPGNAIIVPVKSDKSIVDGKTNSFYFIRTVNEDEYKKSNTISTQFKTNTGASATTVYVANEYFKTASVNLLNDGIYVNPTKAEVAFNVTSVTVEVEMDPDDQTKTWTVAHGEDVTISDIVDKDGKPFEGTPTGNGTFKMNFDANNSTTATHEYTATVTSEGVPHTVTITQLPMEFSITPATQTVAFNATTATVTVHAEKGKSWTATISGPNGVTGYSLDGADAEGKVSGEGTKTLTVTLPRNSTSARNFTVTATMTDPAASASATITQRRAPGSSAQFSVSSFAFNGSNRSGGATSDDGYIRINLGNIGNDDADYWQYGYGPIYDGYIQMGYRQQGGYGQQGQTYRGGITITPIDRLVKITKVEVTYSSDNRGSYDTDYGTGNNRKIEVSSGEYSRSGSTGTWIGASTDAITFTNGFRINSNRYNFPYITGIKVTYEAVQ